MAFQIQQFGILHYQQIRTKKIQCNGEQKWLILFSFVVGIIEPFYHPFYNRKTWIPNIVR